MRLLHYNELDSTNLEARRLWPAHQPEPVAVRAITQTQGMGRNGRAWHSPLGGMWLTVVWPLNKPMHYYQALPLVVGLALTKALEENFGNQLALQIKWPNDVLLHGKKVAGILCQSDTTLNPPAILIGVGLNGDFQIQELNPNLRYPATTLRHELGDKVYFNMNTLTEQFLTTLGEYLRQFEETGFQPFAASLQERLAWRGQIVRGTHGADQPLEGILQGVDAYGRLLIQQGHDVITLSSGELDSLRPPQ